jgi:prephenate dehydrogenase
VRWRKAAILGVGLLGGSLGMALRRRGLAGEVAGFVRRVETACEAVSVGAVDHAGTSLEKAVRGADLVVLCTPVAQMASLALDVVPFLDAGARVTDVGSVKASVVAAAERVVREAGACFVGSHPMAGSEKTGVLSAREDLFCGAVTVVTPTPETAEEAVRTVVGLWESVGSRVMTMSAERHDELVARSSHLPHVLASALAAYVLDPRHPSGQAQLCASGFRDTTRVASGSAEMWRDIALANRDSILAALDGFGAVLSGLRAAIEAGDALAIEDFLRVSARRRAGWNPAGARTESE